MSVVFQSLLNSFKVQLKLYKTNDINFSQVPATIQNLPFTFRLIQLDLALINLINLN